MAQTTYEVKLSVDGNHSVTVKTDNQSETKLAIAWAKATFDRLVGFSSQRDEEGRGASEEIGQEDPPMCAVHQVPMVWQKGRKGYFWSCHQKNEDGSWCDYKPNDR
jgi:hypothetical protein